MKYLFYTGTFILLCSYQARVISFIPKANKEDNTLLWEISGKGLKKPSYLFGTFHLICKKDIPLSRNLEKALENSQSVYMEMDMDDPRTLAEGMKILYMKDGKKISDLYSEKEYSRLTLFFKDSLQIPVGLLQGMKPIGLESFIYTRMMDCNPAVGVETVLQGMAKKMHKEINGFETAAFQGSIFDSIPYETQARQLLETVDSFAKFRIKFRQLVQVYKRQQLDGIEKITHEEDFGNLDNLDKFLYDRNKNWINQLKTILKTQHIFIAVGAGHLVGEHGLINLLRKEGYRVRPVKNQ